MAVKLVKTFQVYQEDRIKTFKDFDDVHKEFLTHAPAYEEGFDDFKKSVSRLTDVFQSISKEIIVIKNELETKHSDLPFAKLIGKIQDMEEKKLHTVVDLQLATQQALDNPGDELCDKNARLIRSGLNKLNEDINEVLAEIRCELYEIMDNKEKD